MTITESMTVAEVASTIPSSVRVLQRHGIDFCCGGKRPIAEACREHGVSFNELTTAIDASAGVASDARDWQREPLHTLITHIIATYHDRLREDLPRLSVMAEKAVRAHGAKAPFLTRLRDVVGELREDLTDHMHKEELVLFPAIKALEAGDRSRADWLAQPIAVMEMEHERAGALLAELRQLTDGYEVPAWACPTVRALYQGLAEVESEMHVHVHLENNILFPRASEIARQWSAHA